MILWDKELPKIPLSTAGHATLPLRVCVSFREGNFICRGYQLEMASGLGQGRACVHSFSARTPSGAECRPVHAAFVPVSSSDSDTLFPCVSYSLPRLSSEGRAFMETLRLELCVVCHSLRYVRLWVSVVVTDLLQEGAGGSVSDNGWGRHWSASLARVASVVFLVYSYIGL